MKKLIILFIFLMPVLVSAQQQEKFSFFIQGGFISSLYVKEAILRSVRSKTDSRRHICPILNAGLELFISKNLRAGTSFSYDHFGVKDRSVEYSVLSYSFRCDRIWKETKKSILYSGLSFGLRTQKKFEDEILMKHTVKPCYQAYLFGFEFKVGHYSFDMSLGMGVSGILNCGMRYRF